MNMFSAQIMLNASNATPGTGDNRVESFHDFSEGYRHAYQTMTFQKKYKDFSLEEHRLADYRQGKAGSSANATSQLSAIPFLRPSSKSPRNDRKKLDLLRGSGIEIHVGLSNSSNTQTELSNIWSLPKNLISYHSPFLQAACSWDFQENYNKRIELPEDDPKMFGLFVEWMYYGSYDASSLSPHPSTDVKCWVLGDKLLCSEFKNYALSHLYNRHISTFFSMAVPCNDVQYAWDNTVPAAKLRQFYVDFVIQYFQNPSKLLGTTEDWDALLQNHSDIRILLLQSFRNDPLKRMQIKDITEYLELDESHLNPNLETRFAQLATRENLEEVQGSSSSLGSMAENGQSDSHFEAKDVLFAETEVVPATVSGRQEDTLEPPPEERKRKPKKKKGKAKLQIQEEETAPGSSAWASRSSRSLT